MAEARIYVGTYAKYNAGSIEGKWMDMEDYADRDEFYAACAELHSDEEDPELMFQDYENIPGSLISESWLSEKFFAARDALVELHELSEPFQIWCNNSHRDLHKDDAADLVTAFEEDYVGQYDSREDYAREVVSEQHELCDFCSTYFDYEQYALDLFCGDYWFDEGHVFRSS